MRLVQGIIIANWKLSVVTRVPTKGRHKTQQQKQKQKKSPKAEIKRWGQEPRNAKSWKKKGTDSPWRLQKDWTLLTNTLQDSLWILSCQNSRRVTVCCFKQGWVLTWHSSNENWHKVLQLLLSILNISSRSSNLLPKCCSHSEYATHVIEETCLCLNQQF